MKKNTGKIIAGVLFVAGFYFIYKYYSKPKGAKQSEPIPSPNILNPTAPKQPSSSSVFPLTMGSKGSKVKELQQAILKYDSKALPKFGADGDFGSETQFAVSKILGKTSIDSQSDINNIITLYNKKQFPFITPNITKPADFRLF
jgi:hypothetical protein